MKQPATSAPKAPPCDPIDMATLELLASWRRQDATTDPDQIRRAEEEIAEFKRAMNENRTASAEPVLFP